MDKRASSFFCIAGFVHSFQPDAFRSTGNAIKSPPPATAAPAGTISLPPQLVEFVEPSTGSKVLLIGTMHYNPTSIKQVEDTLEELAEQNRLGSVVVESCSVRWNTTMEILATKRGQLLKPVLTSEMKAAADKAAAYQRPVVLGDQLINVTGISLSAAFKQTLKDLATPLGGGWSRFYNDVKAAADVALPTGPGYLTPRSFFDPRLLIAAPVSFAKYPLSFLARNPISTAAVFAVLFGLTSLDATSSTAFADASTQEQILAIIETFLFAGLEFAFFGRVLLQVLLAERNEIIAQSILNECRLYSPVKQNKNLWSKITDSLIPSSFFSNEMGLRRILTQDTFYIPKKDEKLESNDLDTIKASNEKVVVAVLGMAHCNGVQKLLREQLV